MRAQGLPISTIIIAALGILVLVIIGAIFGGQMGQFWKATSECPGRCYKLNQPSGAPAGIYSDQACDAEFETRLGGARIPKLMPKTNDPGPWRCDECCILTG